MILVIKNAILKPDTAGAAATGVTDRIVRRSLSKREGEYAGEVRRLLDAALEVIQRCGTSSRPRVADIVGASGLSNDAFYRHFRSKDDLVNALLEDGAARLSGYLAHQMAKARSPEARVRRWVEGVLAQADGDVAAATLAVLWNGSSADGGMAAGRHFAAAPLASLLHEPFATLGSDAPELDAALAAHATLGLLSDCLWRGVASSRSESDRAIEFCLRAVTH
ncbi:MAG TPA: TetR/AcrR family transcriptional regulator [Acidimicrobiales bacterium]|jgi:AcrR family transcriptional regulator|nr:TetR/AcrR family transcriptional regulator [Acidimicrobiales bacterium]